MISGSSAVNSPSIHIFLNVFHQKRRKLSKELLSLSEKAGPSRYILGILQHRVTLSYTGSVKVLCRTAPWAIEVGGGGGCAGNAP